MVSVGNVAKFFATDFVDDVLFPRFIDSVTGVLKLYGIDSIAGVNVKALGDYSKFFDRFRYIPKAAVDAHKLAMTYSEWQAGKKDGTAVINEGIKFIGDSSASLKFLGLVGITVLAPHVKMFGYVKNVCSVYSASITIISSGKELLAIAAQKDDASADKATIDAAKSKRRWDVTKHVLTIILSGSSIGLNGLGGLASWTGPALKAAGKQQIPDWFFSACSVGATGSATAIKFMAAPAA